MANYPFAPKGGQPGIIISPSGDPTGATDYAALQGAMNTQGPTGAPVYLTPGTFILNNPLLWNQTAASTSVLAPSLIGAGSGGNPAAATLEPGVTRLTPSSTFPSGQFMIDYLGPTTTNLSMPGFTVSGMIIHGKSSGGTQLCAGVRGFNQFMARWQDLVIIQPQVPNPTLKPGGIGPNGAVSMYASPTSNALQNRLDHIWVVGAQFTGFYLQEGAGSMLTAVQCQDFQSSAYGFDIGPLTTLIGCVAQGEGFAQFHIADENSLGGANVIMNGCQSIGASFNSSVQALSMAGEQFMTLEATGCFFGYCAGSNVGGDSNALAIFSGYPNAIFTGCTFAATNANINKYVALAASLTAGSLVQFNGCQFTGQYWGNTPAAIFNLNSNPASMLAIRSTPLANPFGSQVVAVPGSGTAVAAVPYDRVFYVTANAAGATSIAVSGGPSVALPLSAVVPVSVPAGQTLTPTYVNAPTWVVEGL